MEDLALFGRDLFGEPVRQKPRGGLADRFGVSPFTVLSARAEWWKERKRAWRSLGLRGEVGRDAESVGVHGWLADVDNVGARTDFAHGWKAEGRSLFDPVLCELVYRWYSAEGAQVVDPFAGGSVRGVVASLLGRPYWGCDLRPEQIAANEAQREEIGADLAEWVCGDSSVALGSAPMADLLFSCPPYGDLERYSDNPADLSALSYAAFRVGHSRIIARAVAKLREDRFAVWVVGDFRCKRGYLRDLTADTAQAFEGAGARLYDKAILVTPVGTLPVRSGRTFEATRKLGRTHQTVLVFVKGDPKRAAQAAKRPPTG